VFTVGSVKKWKFGRFDMELPSIRFSAAGTPDSVPEHFVGLPVIGIQFLQKISQSSIWDFFTM